MDIFNGDAERLLEQLDAVKIADEKEQAKIHDTIKMDAVISLCTRFEGVLRVIDGQGLGEPFYGRMTFRETAGALMKLDELRMWVLEHLRVQAMFAEQRERSRVVETAIAAAQARAAAGPIPAEGRLGEFGSYKLTEGAAPISSGEQAALKHKYKESCKVAPVQLTDGQAQDALDQLHEEQAEEWPWTRIAALLTDGEPDIGDVPVPPAGYEWELNNVYTHDMKDFTPWRRLNRIVPAATIFSAGMPDNPALTQAAE